MDFKIADTWYKALAVAGVALTVAALAVNNQGVITLGIGLVLIGIGEFANHPYQEQLIQNEYGHVQGKITGHPWNPNLPGLVLDGAGLGAVIFGLIRVLFF